MRPTRFAAALALIMLAASVPSTTALDVHVAESAPLVAVVSIEVAQEGARPRGIVSPGWRCVESIPWSPQREIQTFELSCQPTLRTTVVDEWRCQNPVVSADAYGFGTLTATAYCDGVSVSCSIFVAGHNTCWNMAIGTGTPPLRCRVETQGLVAPYTVTCYNDP